jgi:hypothetical protein
MAFGVQDGMRPDGALGTRLRSGSSGAIENGYLDCLRQGRIGGWRTDNQSDAQEPAIERPTSRERPSSSCERSWGLSFDRPPSEVAGPSWAGPATSRPAAARHAIYLSPQPKEA